MLLVISLLHVLALKMEMFVYGGLNGDVELDRWC